MIGDVFAQAERDRYWMTGTGNCLEYWEDEAIREQELRDRQSDHWPVPRRPAGLGELVEREGS